MSFGVVLSRVPWGKVVTLLPPILRAAKELLARNRPEELPYPQLCRSTEDLEARIRQLEENERLQASLVEKIALQLQNFADNIEIIHNRMRAILWLALLAFLFALASLLYIVTR